MFDRYTEKARRVIFFARYEASRFGQPYIESEHLLFGLLREDRMFVGRHVTATQVEAMRREVEGRTAIREKVSTSVDLPLSNESMRILAYAAEEADAAGHEHIGTEHLLAGILREEGCLAADLLRSNGVQLETIRKDLRSATHVAHEGPGNWMMTSGVHIRSSWGSVEVFSGEEKIAVIALPSLPRIGEFMFLKKEGIDHRYRVVNITYHLEQPPTANPAIPQIGRNVSIQVEPA